MVSIVIVSHSEKAAQGAAEIAQEMNMGGIKIVPAGGTGDGRIGTNAEIIMEAMMSVADSDAILVFCDLGSAILSTETAMELLEPEVSAKVRIVDAPLIEGAVVAAIQSGLSDTAEEIIEAAEGAKLLPKLQG